MEWLNQPPDWQEEGKRITVLTGSKTDAWRITEDGGIRDNAHFYYREIAGDFEVEARISGEYSALYDQAGLMIRLDETTWLKCGIELFNGVQHASAVVTRHYSDWSVVPLPQNPPSIRFRVTRRGGTAVVAYALEGEPYTMLRQAWLTDAPAVRVGLMCAAPTGPGFKATFEDFAVRSL